MATVNLESTVVELDVSVALGEPSAGGEKARCCVGCVLPAAAAAATAAACASATEETSISSAVVVEEEASEGLARKTVWLSSGTVVQH